MSYIINSLLDTDFYKFTMGQLVFKHFRDVPVRYAFKNRTAKVPLGRIIKEADLRRELDHVMELRLGNSEYHYLLGTYEYKERMFREDYLQFLKNLELQPYELRYEGDAIKLEFAGPWSSEIQWETMALSIINELYYRVYMERLSEFERDAVHAEGVLRFKRKVDVLKKNPGIVFTDFGTRRRFSFDQQDYVNGVLAKEFPATQFRGTSNTYLAMKHGLTPMGTSAHELFMVMAGIKHNSDESIRQSHNEVLRYWWEEYGYGLSIALTDTYGSDFFFLDMTAEQARQWKGLRQDSGDPFDFGEKAIKFYEKHGIDPKKDEKIIVFSDGLDIEMIEKLYERFHDRIKVTFGWGTNLTNDLGFPALSLVVKAVEANGNRLVKLSDNLAKATGDMDDIARFKSIFGYSGDNYEECKY
ncbi:MAG: nicotinate phosphoribosyltransferase [Parcubacteria group bacterium Gr01-1014_3]|nr:MAG: nicotinate phosphoribosyltransferase [Parcubacteria group bacterium Gr01-1014_3]